MCREGNRSTVIRGSRYHCPPRIPPGTRQCRRVPAAAVRQVTGEIPTARGCSVNPSERACRACGRGGVRTGPTCSMTPSSVAFSVTTTVPIGLARAETYRAEEVSSAVVVSGWAVVVSSPACIAVVSPRLGAETSVFSTVAPEQAVTRRKAVAGMNRCGTERMRIRNLEAIGISLVRRWVLCCGRLYAWPSAGASDSSDSGRRVPSSTSSTLRFASGPRAASHSS